MRKMGCEVLEAPGVRHDSQSLQSSEIGRASEAERN